MDYCNAMLYGIKDILFRRKVYYSLKPRLRRFAYPPRFLQGVKNRESVLNDQ